MNSSTTESTEFPTTTTGPEEFQAFPSAKVHHAEAQRRHMAPYQSPHLSKPRVAADDMSVGTPTPSTASIATSDLSHIKIQNPGFVQPTSEAEGISVELPSRFAFYGFKDLYVKTLKGLHLAKLSRAKEEQSTLHMVEVVSSVLSTSTGERNLGFRLTVPDFYWVLYWLRLHSFTKAAFVHESVCTNEVHIRRIGNGELAPDSLRQGEIINKSSLRTVMLDAVPNMDNYTLDYPAIHLAPCTMQDAIEMTEDPDFESEEFRFSAQIAVYLRTTTPSSLRERIKLVEDMTADDIQIVKAFEKSVAAYGTEEKILVTCKGCGATKVDTIKLDAHSFFPSP